MIGYLGVGIYFAADLREHPDMVVGAIDCLAEVAKTRISTYGMLTGTDKFARPTILSATASRQLTTDIRGGVFSDVTAYSGRRSDPSTTLAIQVSPNTSPGSSLLSVAVVRCQKPEEVLQGEGLGTALWDVFEGLYGLVVMGPSYAEVAGEITCTPITRWGSPNDAATERRLLSLQSFRNQFGRLARGVAWGTLLGAELVERLGGTSQVTEGAPVFEVRAVPRGLYLRLTESPEPLGCIPRTAVADLAKFLEPITPKDLVSMDP